MLERPPSEQGGPAAVLVGLDSMQGLQAARILARRNVPVLGIAAPPGNALSRTRVCREVLLAPTEGDDLVDALVRLGSGLSERAVLFPCEDNSVLTISRNRSALNGLYHVLLPEPDVVEMLMDKVAFYSYANDHGLPIPSTHFIDGEADLHAAAEALRYPAVVKPRDSSAKQWENETIHKAFKVRSSEELIAVYRRFSAWTPSFIAQEWIEGDDSQLYSCNCYFNRDSEPLATFVARKLRQWPPETGVSCLGEEVRNDSVLEETIRLFRSVGYHGLGYLEMKRDLRNGQMFIVEPNIGRPTGRSAIAEAGGVELLYTAYCDAVGLPLPEARQQTYGNVKWMHVRKDLQSAVQYWRRGELTPREWWHSVRGKKAYALASWTDPLPFILDGWSAVRSFLSPRKRRKRAAVRAGADDNVRERAA